MITEESQGTLSPVGNRASSVKVEGCLTARPIGRAGPKGGLSDPAVLDGKAVAQQIKGTSGITGLSPLSVHSGEEVWHLDVGSTWIFYVRLSWALGWVTTRANSAYNGGALPCFGRRVIPWEVEECSEFDP